MLLPISSGSFLSAIVAVVRNDTVLVFEIFRRKKDVDFFVDVDSGLLLESMIVWALPLRLLRPLQVECLPPATNQATSVPVANRSERRLIVRGYADSRLVSLLQKYYHQRPIHQASRLTSSFRSHRRRECVRDGS